MSEGGPRRRLLAAAGDMGNSRGVIEIYRPVSPIQNFYILTERALLAVAIFYLAISGVVYYCDVLRVPTTISVNTPGEHQSHTFSASNARKDILVLSSIGEKFIGSYTKEKLAVIHLLKELRKIELDMENSNTLQLDIQRVTGCFPLELKYGATSCYGGVTNIIAKIGPQGESNSILVNCALNPSPASPAASDVVSCSIMLDVLRALSKSKEKLSHSIVFLFNGVEGSSLQAAHGFITSHKWASSVQGFINLRANGPGGKQMLFQADKYRNWILQAYIKSARHPQVSLTAQDIFKSGLLPSNTDYRIFAEFGDLPGLDFAFFKNGYIYRTKYDQPYFINDVALQQAGQNLLNLIYECLKSPAMDDSSHGTTGRLIFYDFLGLFMVSYGNFLSCLQSLMIFIFGLYEIYAYLSYFKMKRVPLSNGFKEIGKAFAVLIISVIGALECNVILAVILSYVGYAMAWYRQPYLIIFTYGFPAMATLLYIQSVFKDEHETEAEMFQAERAHFEAAKLFWVLLEVVTFNMPSHFICDLFLLFPTLIRLSHKFPSYYDDSLEIVYTFLHVHLLSQVFPMLMLFYCGLSLYNILIPILGHVGTSVNPEIVIAVVTALFVFISSIFTISLVQCTSTVKKTINILSLVAAVTLALIIMTPFGFPYSGNEASPAPMRTVILHADYNFYNQTGDSIFQNSGYFILPLDWNGPKMLQPYMKKPRGVGPINCQDELVCKMLFHFADVSLPEESYFIPGPAVDIPHYGQSLKLVATEDHPKSNSKIMTFMVKGTDQMTLLLVPHPGFNLTTWSLYKGKPLPGLKWKDSDTYTVFYSCGSSPKPWEFSVVLENEKADKGPALDIMLVTHHIHGKKIASEKFYKFLENLPPWVHFTFWTSSLINHEF